MVGRSTVAAAATLLATVLAGPGCVNPPPANDEMAYLDTVPVVATRDPHASTVRIRSTTCEGMGVGSGFLLDSDTIVTNRHVVEGATELTVETYLGVDLVVDVASQGTVADLAVLDIKQSIEVPGGSDGASGGLDVAQIAFADASPGSFVRAFGYAGGGPMRVTEGLVDSYATDDELGNEGQIMKARLEIRPGNSGGPALNAEDEVVGVVYAIELRTKLALIVPVSTLFDVLEDESLLQPVKPC